MEECFFEKLLADNQTKCVVTSLLPLWKKLGTQKPSCRSPSEEMAFQNQFLLREKFLRDCECKRRCSMMKYEIAFRSAPACGSMVGTGVLFFTFVSGQVRNNLILIFSS